MYIQFDDKSIINLADVSRITRDGFTIFFYTKHPSPMVVNQPALLTSFKFDTEVVAKKIFEEISKLLEPLKFTFS